MAMTSAAAVNTVLTMYERALRLVHRGVTGDFSALYRAGRVAAACAASTAGVSGEMAAARTALASSWAAPSGEGFQAGSEPYPEGIAAAQRLFAGLGAGLERLALTLDLTESNVATVSRGFGEYAKYTRGMIADSPQLPEEWRTEAIRIGHKHLSVAKDSARRLDVVLGQFATATNDLARELAAAGPVKP
jgi:hypothetical protein